MYEEMYEQRMLRVGFAYWTFGQVGPNLWRARLLASTGQILNLNKVKKWNLFFLDLIRCCSCITWFRVVANLDN